ncbi:MAG: polyphenol oxidase family protein [marine benthic group bacterium]|nr:polyphenol oxidase family protein [Candidatus Benthicola marisminoris]
MVDGPAPRYVVTGWPVGQTGVVAGVTAVEHGARRGSDSDYGVATGGGPAVARRRYERLASAVGMVSSVAVKQVHGTRIVRVGVSEPGFRVAGEADGLSTAVPGVLLSVTAADCIPVLIADREGRCVAVAHAGWRGAAAGILERTVQAIEAHFGVAPSDLEICLGPGICGECYEVGSEVLQAFNSGQTAPACLDLRAELHARAVHAGLPEASVAILDWCTRCGPVYLHSHRVSGERAGRMAAFIGLRPNPGTFSGKDGHGELR